MFCNSAISSAVNALGSGSAAGGSVGCVGIEVVGGGSVARVGEEEDVGIGRLVVLSVGVSETDGSTGGLAHSAADMHSTIISRIIKQVDSLHLKSFIQIISLHYSSK